MNAVYSGNKESKTDDLVIINVFHCLFLREGRVLKKGFRGIKLAMIKQRDKKTSSGWKPHLVDEGSGRAQYMLYLIQS